MKRWRLKFWQIWFAIQELVFGRRHPFQTIYVEELPDKLAIDCIYLVGENDYLWSTALLCPCGCQSTIQLNLLPDAKPCWRVEEHEDSTISLYPSVWSRKGCGSHYLIRKGFIKWCYEE